MMPPFSFLMEPGFYPKQVQNSNPSVQVESSPSIDSLIVNSKKSDFSKDFLSWVEPRSSLSRGKQLSLAFQLEESKRSSVDVGPPKLEPDCSSSQKLEEKKAVKFQSFFSVLRLSRRKVKISKQSSSPSPSIQAGKVAQNENPANGSVRNFNLSDVGKDLPPFP